MYRWEGLICLHRKVSFEGVTQYRSFACFHLVEEPTCRTQSVIPFLSAKSSKSLEVQ